MSSTAQARIERPGARHEKEFLRAVRRSRALHRGLVTPPNDAEKYRQFVKGLRARTRKGFLVLPADCAGIAGVVNVSEIVRGSFQSAYLGYYAFAPLAGRGLMREGLALVIDHCFREMGLHRLEANVQPHNERSAALVEGLGFRLEGYSPRYLKISGRWRDHQRWAILSEEWRGRRIG